MDNTPPVVNGGSPQPRVNLVPIIHSQSVKNNGSKHDKPCLFEVLEKSVGETGWFQGSFEGQSEHRHGRGPWDRWNRGTRQDQHEGKASISQLRLFEQCIIDKRILYQEISLTHPITN